MNKHNIIKLENMKPKMGRKTSAHIFPRLFKRKRIQDNMIMVAERALTNTT